jgi:hypothetical protein
MNTKERLAALRELAKKNPHATAVGFLWKNPLNPRSKGIRWTPRDLEIFRKFQIEYGHKN